MDGTYNYVFFCEQSTKVFGCSEIFLGSYRNCVLHEHIYLFEFLVYYPVHYFSKGKKNLQTFCKRLYVPPL